MNLLLIATLSLQCMVTYVQEASRTEILKGWKYYRGRPTSSSRALRLLKYMEEDGDIDTRLLALSWIEGRLRTGVKRGDRGRACGIFQIHARHSYPMFSRKRGYVDWDEKESKHLIERECRQLEHTKYSITTMNRYLDYMDRRDLHPCHHNSGPKGKCNTWYKQRLDFWIGFFEIAKIACDPERRENIMAMMRTGNPIPTAPAPLMQGYMDAISGKDAQSEDPVYKSGYDLALLVKEGKAEAPTWATEGNG
jgi:hypothetical protein